MRGYSYNFGGADVFEPAQIRDWRLATELVACVSEREPVVRCHELARTVIRFLEHRWDVVDGHFGSCQHSWLVGVAPQHDPVILDVYCVARLPMVQLLYHRTNLQLPYKPGERREDVAWGTVDGIAHELRERHRFLLTRGKAAAE